VNSAILTIRYCEQNFNIYVAGPLVITFNGLVGPTVRFTTLRIRHRGLPLFGPCQARHKDHQPPVAGQDIARNLNDVHQAKTRDIHSVNLPTVDVIRHKGVAVLPSIPLSVNITWLA
jgi:hypothetical protein